MISLTATNRNNNPIEQRINIGAGFCPAFKDTVNLVACTGERGNFFE